MKNKTAFIFVLLANAALFAHAVIPHHHHLEDELEISVECSHHEEHEHVNEQTPVCNDDHQTCETIECIISQAIVSETRQFKQVDNSTRVLLSDLFFQNIELKASCLINSSLATFRILDSTSLYLIHLSSSQGLRAPPIC